MSNYYKIMTKLPTTTNYPDLFFKLFCMEVVFCENMTVQTRGWPCRSPVSSDHFSPFRLRNLTELAAQLHGEQCMDCLPIIVLGINEENGKN